MGWFDMLVGSEEGFEDVLRTLRKPKRSHGRNAERLRKALAAPWDGTNASQCLDMAQKAAVAGSPEDYAGDRESLELMAELLLRIGAYLEVPALFACLKEVADAHPPLLKSLAEQLAGDLSRSPWFKAMVLFDAAHLRKQPVVPWERFEEPGGLSDWDKAEAEGMLEAALQVCRNTGAKPPTGVLKVIVQAGSLANPKLVRKSLTDLASVAPENLCAALLLVLERPWPWSGIDLLPVLQDLGRHPDLRDYPELVVRYGLTALPGLAGDKLLELRKMLDDIWLKHPDFSDPLLRAFRVAGAGVEGLDPEVINQMLAERKSFAGSLNAFTLMIQDASKRKASTRIIEGLGEVFHWLQRASVQSAAGLPIEPPDGLLSTTMELGITLPDLPGSEVRLEDGFWAEFELEDGLKASVGDKGWVRSSRINYLDKLQVRGVITLARKEKKHA